jgi:hypothetical protein
MRAVHHGQESYSLEHEHALVPYLRQPRSDQRIGGRKLQVKCSLALKLQPSSCTWSRAECAPQAARGLIGGAVEYVLRRAFGLYGAIQLHPLNQPIYLSPYVESNDQEESR